VNLDQDAIRPRVTFLSHEAKEAINAAVRELLQDIGMLVLNGEARALLADAGCRVDPDHTVHIPPALVQQALESAPNRVEVGNRHGESAMDLGGRRCFFGTGSDLLYTIEPGRRERHRSVLEDVRRTGRVVDALPNLDFAMSLATPSDCPPHRSYLLSVQALMESCTKPVVCTADKREDLLAMWEMAAILRGGEDELRENPYLIHYAEPVSPLKHPADVLDKLLLCADKGLPLVYSPAPIAGSTAPISIAGHVVQGLAECFCGLVIHQLRARGAPFIMGMGPAVLDMLTVECSYNAPEYYLSYAAVIEMSHFYDLPSWGYAGHSDSQLPDGQATFEAGMITALSVLGGANLCHDVGYLDFGRMGSLEMVVAGDEMISQLRRMARGIPVNDASLALDVIRESAPKGHFLGHPHTRGLVRDVQWRPRLTSRLNWDRWQGEGGKSFGERALARLEEILEQHQPPPLDEETRRAIQERVDRFE
jgi:trimethylamine--corrinoid protein Co-methyltransferase